ncbi:MAG: DUF1254 domain-containing protein, partial [Methyloceanibacter sp.]
MQLRVPLLYILLCLVLAGLIHIAAVLALPGLAPKNAWARLVPLGPANTMIQIPPLAPGNEVMPMMAPDVRYAFCRFDLAQGPVRLKGSVPSDLWMIAFYAPEGDNFYTVPGSDVRSAQLDLVIALADQPVAEAGVDAPEDADELFVVKSPAREGVAIIRAPLSGPSR